MEDDTKKKLAGFATALQGKAEQKAKASTGWQKVLWALACVACAVAGYFLNSCTTTYTQSAAGDVAFTSTIVVPAEWQK